MLLVSLTVDELIFENCVKCAVHDHCDCFVGHAEPVSNQLTVYLHCLIIDQGVLVVSKDFLIDHLFYAQHLLSGERLIHAKVALQERCERWFDFVLSHALDSDWIAVCLHF